MFKEHFSKPLSTCDVVVTCIGGLLGATATAIVILSGCPPQQVLGFMAACYIPVLLLHELAHAAAGAWVGGTVNRMKLGRNLHFTSKPWSFKFFGFPWEIYSFPLTGMVLVYFTNPQRYRRDTITMIAAGPLISLLATIIGILLFFVSLPIPPSLLIAWSLLNFYFFLGTAVPYRRVSRGKSQQTDGQRIRTILALSEPEIRERCKRAIFELDIQKAMKEVDKLSAQEAVVLYEANPERVAVLVFMLSKLEDGKDPRLHDYVYKLISHPNMPTPVLVRYLDAYITSDLPKGFADQKDFYDRLSHALLVADNYSITSKGTRGSVLVEIGRIDEGKALLKEVLEHTQSPVDVTYANIFLALAEKQLDNFALAREYAAKAAQTNPQCPALTRVADLLPLQTIPNSKR